MKFGVNWTTVPEITGHRTCYFVLLILIYLAPQLHTEEYSNTVMFQALKTTKKENLAGSLKCTPTRPFQILPVLILFGKYFSTSQITAICFYQCA